MSQLTSRISKIIPSETRATVTECQHEWTEPQPGTIRETGERIKAQQCVHCQTWLIYHDTTPPTIRWPITVDLDSPTEACAVCGARAEW